MARRQRRFPLQWLVLAGLLLAAWWFLRTPDTTPALPAPAASTPAGTTSTPLELPPAPSPSAAGSRDAATALPGFLPAEAHATIALIQRGGPFPHRQDGSVFFNREGRLPARPRGHYREYTVETPGLNHRGARRIVTGGQPPASWYYTDDHYDSFRQFQP